MGFQTHPGGKTHTHIIKSERNGGFSGRWFTPFLRPSSLILHSSLSVGEVLHCLVNTYALFNTERSECGCLDLWNITPDAQSRLFAADLFIEVFSCLMTASLPFSFIIHVYFCHTPFFFSSKFYIFASSQGTTGRAEDVSGEWDVGTVSGQV